MPSSLCCCCPSSAKCAQFCLWTHSGFLEVVVLSSCNSHSHLPVQVPLHHVLPLSCLRWSARCCIITATSSMSGESVNSASPCFSCNIMRQDGERKRITGMFGSQCEAGVRILAAGTLKATESSPGMSHLQSGIIGNFSPPVAASAFLYLFSPSSHELKVSPHFRAKGNSTGSKEQGESGG